MLYENKALFSAMIFPHKILYAYIQNCVKKNLAILLHFFQAYSDSNLILQSMVLNFWYANYLASRVNLLTYTVIVLNKLSAKLFVCGNPVCLWSYKCGSGLLLRQDFTVTNQVTPATRKSSTIYYMCSINDLNVRALWVVVLTLFGFCLETFVT